MQKSWNTFSRFHIIIIRDYDDDDDSNKKTLTNEEVKLKIVKSWLKICKWIKLGTKFMCFVMKIEKIISQPEIDILVVLSAYYNLYVNVYV